MGSRRGWLRHFALGAALLACWQIAPAAGLPEPGCYGMMVPYGDGLFYWLNVTDVRLGDAILLEGLVEDNQGNRLTTLKGILDQATGKLVLTVQSSQGRAHVVVGAYLPEKDAFLITRAAGAAQVVMMRADGRRPASTRPSGGAGEASLRLLSASATPSPAKPGESVKLTFTYALKAADGGTTVNETVRARHGTDTLAERTVPRTVTVAGGEARLTANYEVRCGQPGDHSLDIVLTAPGHPVARQTVAFSIADQPAVGDNWQRSGPVISGRRDGATTPTPGLVPPDMKLNGTAVVVTNPATGKSITVTFSDPPAVLAAPGRLKVDIQSTASRDVSLTARCDVIGQLNPTARDRLSVYIATYARRYEQSLDEAFAPPGATPITLTCSVDTANSLSLVYTYSRGGAPTRGTTITDLATGTPAQADSGAVVAGLGASPLTPGSINVPALQGAVETLGADGQWRPLVAGADLSTGTQVRAGPGGAAVLVMPTGDLVRLEPNTTIVAGVPTKPGAPKTALRLAGGGLAVASAGGGTAVATDNATFSPRGTAFVVRHDRATGRSSVITGQGEVLAQPVQAGQPTVTVPAGYQAVATQERVEPPVASGQNPTGHPDPPRPPVTTVGVGQIVAALSLAELGLELEPRDGIWTVVHVGEAARRAAPNVRPGDELVRVGRTAVGEMDAEAVAKLLRQPVGEPHTVQIRRPDYTWQQEFTYTPR